MRYLAAGGFLGPAVFTAVLIKAASAQPGYSHVHNFISELGATGAAGASFMNLAGFLPGGILIVALGLALFLQLPRRGLTAAGSLLVALFGLGVATSGIVSCDLGCPLEGGTLANAAHNIIAPVAFQSLIAAAICLGIYWRNNENHRFLSLFSFVISIASIGFFAGLIGSFETRELTGLWQRLLVGALFLWCAIVGYVLVTQSRSGPPSNNRSEQDA